MQQTITSSTQISILVIYSVNGCLEKWVCQTQRTITHCFFFAVDVQMIYTTFCFCHRLHTSIYKLCKELKWKNFTFSKFTVGEEWGDGESTSEPWRAWSTNRSSSGVLRPLASWIASCTPPTKRDRRYSNSKQGSFLKAARYQVCPLHQQRRETGDIQSGNGGV